ncbi:MAG: MFS transporter [Defluviitaleaceae bacterium]|nr:MFS transporter [Defluviitaleaceae bacterium]
MTTATKLWNKNFIKYIFAYELSEIGTALLTFAIPIYILIATNNPALLGTIFTLNLLPHVLVTPIGGLLADSVSKKSVIVVSQFSIVFIIGIYALISGSFNTHLISVGLLFLMTTLQAIQGSSFETVLYSIIPMDDLMKANSVTYIMMIGSGVIIPILSGFLLRRLGLEFIIYISLILFFLSAVVNASMKVKFEKPEKIETGFFKAVLADFNAGFKYVWKENINLKRATIGIFLYALLITPALNLIPSVFIINGLGMNESNLGLAQGIIALGGITGILIQRKSGEKINVSKLPGMLLLMSVVSIFTSILFLLTSGTLAYILIVIGITFMNIFIMMSSLIYFTYLGTNTPEEIVGKVMSFAIVIMTLGGAIAQFTVSRLFNIAGDNLALAALVLPIVVLISVPLMITRGKGQE